jgi:hypothetical protein
MWDYSSGIRLKRVFTVPFTVNFQLGNVHKLHEFAFRLRGSAYVYEPFIQYDDRTVSIHHSCWLSQNKKYKKRDALKKRGRKCQKE